MTTRKTRKMGRMGRRRLLQTAASLGMSTTAIKYLSQDVVAKKLGNADDEVLRLDSLVHTEEIESGKPPEREPRYYTISRDKWVEVESAHDARQQIDELLNSRLESTENILSMVETITSGHRRKKAVVVYYTQIENSVDNGSKPDIDFRQLKEETPAKIAGVAGRGTEHATTVKGVPVLVKKGYQQLQYYEENQKPDIPGGCKFQTEPYEGYNTSVPARTASSGTPAYDYDKSSYVMVTSGHVYARDHKRTDFHQPEYNQYNYNYIGEVDGNKIKNWDSFDAAVVTNESDNNFVYELAADGGGYQDGDITGTLARDRLVDEEGNSSYAINHQGITSGSPSGPITGVSDTLFATDTENSSGDSGGPHFRTKFDGSTPRYLIAGIHRGEHTYSSDPGGSGDSIATIMEEIETQWNLSV